MNANEYIDAISRDLQDLITALDNDPNTSALVKGRAKFIQERINLYYNSMFDEYEQPQQIPDAPPYKIGDEDYIDRVYCEHDPNKKRVTTCHNSTGVTIIPCDTCTFHGTRMNDLPCCNCTNWSEYTLYGVKTDWKKSVRYI